MVKVKEFCCGCSLRSGTLIIAWSLFVYNCSLFVLFIFHYLSYRKYFRRYEFPSQTVGILIYDVIRSIAGMTVSIMAIWALQKNKVKFLNGLLWYLCYYVTATAFSTILLLFIPSWEEFLQIGNPIFSPRIFDRTEGAVFFSMVYVVLIGIVSYFALVVRSYQVYSLRNGNQNVQFVGPDATTLGYTAA